MELSRWDRLAPQFLASLSGTLSGPWSLRKAEGCEYGCEFAWLTIGLLPCREAIPEERI